MALKLTINFRSPEALSGQLAHRIRNFGEDLERTLADESAGHVDNMDSAVASIAVTIDSHRKLGRAMTIAKKILQQHQFFDGVHLET